MIDLPKSYLLHDDRYLENCKKRIDKFYAINQKADDLVVLEVVIQEATDNRRSKERRHIFALIGDIIKAGHQDEYGKEHSKEGWFYYFKVQYNYIYDTVIVGKIDGVTVEVPIPKSISEGAKGTERMSYEEAQNLRWSIEEFMIDHDIPMTDFREGL